MRRLIIVAGSGDHGAGAVPYGAKSSCFKRYADEDHRHHRRNQLGLDARVLPPDQPLYSAPILLYSIAFAEFSKQERLAAEGDWRPLQQTMVEAARSLERGGADFIIVASNTMNSTDDVIEENVKIPVLDIIDAVGAAVSDRGLKTVALLGTKYTMEEDFYRGRLEGDYGLDVVTPNAAERDYINDVIFNELCAGVFRKESRDRFVQIMNRLVKEEGAEGIILGCTEIPLLVKDADTTVPTFDTTRLHSAAAVRYSLGDQ
jgi:aspartate racemase